MAFRDWNGGRQCIALLLFLLSISALSSAAEPIPLGKTFFQTNVPFDPRIALPSDFVVVHRHGAPDIGEALKTWQEQDYPPARMFFIGSDAGRKYTEGKYDGENHLDEAETRRNGSVIECAGVRPYMVPTEGWTRYIREMAVDSIEQGAQAILPEEPLAHTESGYSEAFKRIWKERYGEEWRAPHSSPEAFWKASKLKSDLYYELVEAVLDETTRAEKNLAREVSFILPIHSLLSHAAGHMVYPSGRSLDLIEKGLDGFVGQVWTGPIAWSMSRSEGKKMTRKDDFFESAYLLYSYFANLSYGTGVPCFMLADPVEDDPQYKWEDYKDWYEKSLVTMLLFPWADHFEVMPWPDRVFLPGHTMGGGSPGPEPYRRTLVSVFSALREISRTPASDFDRAKNPVLGYVVNDTLGWQRGGPDGSRMESLHGLTVPWLKRGVPIQIVPLERSEDPNYLDRFDMLVVSYDMMKPLSVSRNRHLAEWVKRGGILFYAGEENAYDEIPSWWREEGFDSPAAHLRSILEDAGLDLKARDDSVFPLLEGDCGKGRVLWVEAPASEFAEKPDWAMAYLDLISKTFQKRNIDLLQGRPMMVRRGPFVVARTTRATLLLTGTYIDLLDPDLKVQENPNVPRNSFVFLKEVDNPKDLDRPEILFAGPDPRSMETDGVDLSCEFRSPDGTPVTLRVASGGETLKEVRLRKGSDTKTVPTVYDPDTRSHLIVTEIGWEGGTLEIDWE